MKLLQRFLALVCLVLLFVFCISNREAMTVRFLNWESPELPVFLLLVFAFLTGAVLALLWQSLRSMARPKEKPARRADKKLDKKEAKQAEPEPEPAAAAAPDNAPGPEQTDADSPATIPDKHEGEH